MALHDPRPLPLELDPHEDPAPVPALANGTLYSLFAVGGLLGHRGKPVSWLCKYLDALMAHDGFPQPLPLRLADGSTSRAARKDSRWPSIAVDAWLSCQVPAGIVAAADTSVLAAASARLDARARGLTLINGGRA